MWAYNSNIKCYQTFWNEKYANIAPENGPSQKEIHLPTSNPSFLGAILVSGRVTATKTALSPGCGWHFFVHDYRCLHCPANTFALADGTLCITVIQFAGFLSCSLPARGWENQPNSKVDLYNINLLKGFPFIKGGMTIPYIRRWSTLAHMEKDGKGEPDSASSQSTSYWKSVSRSNHLRMKHHLGGGFKYFLIFAPKLGEDEPILTVA